MKARPVYDGSDGDLTKSYYAELLKHGARGAVALNLFRAHKASMRAKIYRGRYRGMAYEKKEYSLGLLIDALKQHGPDLNVTFGWKPDPNTPIGSSDASWILYIDLPTGQVSFHSPSRGFGPDYPGEWDGKPLSDVRILAYCDITMGIEPEDLKDLLKDERNKRTEYARRGKVNTWRRRIDALQAEISGYGKLEAQHIEHQAELFGA